MTIANQHPPIGWCLNPKGLLNGTLSHPFGIAWRVQDWKLSIFPCSKLPVIHRCPFLPSVPWSICNLEALVSKCQGYKTRGPCCRLPVWFWNCGPIKCGAKKPLEQVGWNTITPLVGVVGPHLPFYCWPFQGVIIYNAVYNDRRGAAACSG